MKDQKQLRELTLLLSIAERVQGPDPAALVQRDALESLCGAMDASGGVLMLADAKQMGIEVSQGLSKDGEEGLEGFAPWPMDARGAEPVVVADVGSDARVAVVRQTLSREGIRALACVPLVHRGHLVGEIVLLRTRAEPFEASEVRVMAAVASYLAFAVWRERTDQDRAELLLRFEAERSVLESVVKQLPAGVLLADVPSGRVLLSNSQVSRIWGRPFENAGSLEDYRDWGGLDADGSPLAPSAWPLARTVSQGETVLGEDVVIRRGDGSTGTVHMSSAPVCDGQGRHLAAVATVLDVTEARAEAGRRDFLEEATGVLHGSLDAASTLGALANLLVRRHADWCVVYRMTATVLERAAAAHAEVARAALMAPLAVGTVELSQDHAVSRAVRGRTTVAVDEAADLALEGSVSGHPEGREASLAALGSGCALVFPLVVRERVLGAVMVVRAGGGWGQSERQLLEEVARRAALALDNALLYEHARLADQSKASFLAVVSHEFRTPLSAILGYTDLLSAAVHGPVNARQREHLDRVKASVRHLSYLVDEVLTFARMEAGREERVRTAAVEMVALVGEAAELVRPMADAAGLSLRTRLPDAPLHVSTDAPKVRQILINLLSNAVKYTRSGWVELALESAGDRIRCRVRDTGAGIAAVHREKVFEPYWRVESGCRPERGGTGLGLAVARRLARLLGGDIRLESEEGSWSEFTLELPLVPAARVDPAPLS